MEIRKKAEKDMEETRVLHTKIKHTIESTNQTLESNPTDNKNNLLKKVFFPLTVAPPYLRKEKCKYETPHDLI